MFHREAVANGGTNARSWRDAVGGSGTAGSIRAHEVRCLRVRRAWPCGHVAGWHRGATEIVRATSLLDNPNQRGLMPFERDTLADTGSLYLCITQSVQAELQLEETSQKTITTADGKRRVGLLGRAADNCGSTGAGTRPGFCARPSSSGPGRPSPNRLGPRPTISSKNEPAKRIKPACALAFKWIRILWRCWQTRTPYDESRYIAAFTKQDSPLIKMLQAT